MLHFRQNSYHEFLGQNNYAFMQKGGRGGLFVCCLCQERAKPVTEGEMNGADGSVRSCISEERGFSR